MWGWGSTESTGARLEFVPTGIYRDSSVHTQLCWRSWNSPPGWRCRTPSLVSALPPTHLPGRKQGNPLNFPSFNALPSISLLPFLPFPKGRQECSSLLTKTHLQEQSGDSEQSEHHWRCKNHPALRLNPLVCYPLRKHNIFIWKSDFLSQNELISLWQNIESKIQKVCRKKNALMWNIIGLVKNRTACFQRRQEKTEGEMEET